MVLFSICFENKKTQQTIASSQKSTGTDYNHTQCNCFINECECSGGHHFNNANCDSEALRDLIYATEK